MRSVRSFVAALAVLGLAAHFAPSASAASTPLVVADAKGDALDARASMDLVSVKLESKNFKPKNTPSLVVTFELAGPLDRSTATAINYNLDAEIPGCGYLEFTYAPGTVLEGGPGGAYSNISTSCGGPPSSVGDGTYLGIDSKVEVVGKTIVMWTSWASLTKEIRAASTLTKITASTQNAEPLTGIIGLGLLGPGATDTASTDKAWKYA